MKKTKQMFYSLIHTYLLSQAFTINFFVQTRISSCQCLKSTDSTNITDHRQRSPGGSRCWITHSESVHNHDQIQFISRFEILLQWFFCFVKSPKPLHGFGAVTASAVWQFTPSPMCGSHTFKSLWSPNESSTQEILVTSSEASSITDCCQMGRIDLVTWSDSQWGIWTLACHRPSLSCQYDTCFRIKIVCVECLE